jgi:hypothetical protein
VKHNAAIQAEHAQKQRQLDADETIEAGTAVAHCEVV